MATSVRSIPVLICVLVLLYSSQVLAKERVTVESIAGTFNGYVRSFQGYGEQVKSERFLGIPYAEPPVGDLRFTKPHKKAKLTETYDASYRRPGCLQFEADLGGERKTGNTIETSVDCLYLNIYRPHGTKSNGELPVFLVIHGGAFVLGQSDIYPGDVFSIYGDVIVVVINYRLNISGFLSTGDKYLPGNLGLWDQHMAIQWVHDNIMSFGGNPNTLTIAGLSAGSASVIYQAMLPENKGLFQRVVAQSGSITCPWAFQPDPLPVARRLGGLVGCSTTSSTEDLAACLTGKTDEELYAVYNNPDNEFQKFPIVVAVDGEFVPATPKDMFHGSSDETKKRRMNFAQYDLMTSVTDGEGLMMLLKFFGVDDGETFTLTRHQFEKKIIPEIVSRAFGKEAPKILNDIIIAEYTDWFDPNNDKLTRDAFIRLSSDYIFNIQAVETAEVHRSLTEKDTYFYLFAAKSSQHMLFSPSWSDLTNHVDDWSYMLGYDDQDDGYNAWTEPYGQKPESWELELSKAFITMLANFARTGDPNQPQPTAYGTASEPWPKFDVDQRQYVIIRQNGTSIGTNPLARAVNFWKHLLPKVAANVAQGRQSDRLYCDKDGC